jgi:hypothetical protein
VLFIPANSEEYGSATTSTTITVTRAPVQIAITSSLNPSPYGMSVVFSIHFTGPAGTVIPTGTAQLSDGTQPLGPVTLDPLGNATYSVSTWHAGSHALNVAYQGDPNFF